MTTVIVPADEAATLLPTIAYGEEYTGEPVACGWLKPARRFVVHTANIDPTPCETCRGDGESWVMGDDRETPDWWTCPICNGEGAVPAVVTLAVPTAFLCPECGHDATLTGTWLLCGNCRYSWMRDPSRHPLGFRPVGVATVKHCWPIVGDDMLEVEHVGMSHIAGQYRIYICGPGTNTATDITGQVVGNPQPGAWLLELAEVNAT